MSGGSAGACDPPGSGSSLKPYLKRKKSSFGETKVALIGADGVGKSALSVRFLTKRFIGEYDQTSEAKYKYTTVVDGESVQFEILDTISENDDLGAREDVIRWADGFMLVYSVVSRKTFDILEDMRRKIDEAKKGTNIPLVIIGNKCDLAHMRQVTRDEDIERNDAVLVKSASISPYPVEVPGTLTAAIEFQVTRNLTQGIKLGVQITRAISWWGGTYETHVEIPCFFMVGSCQYDLCRLLDQTYKKTGTANCPRQLIDSNIGCTCPILAGSYTLQHSLFRTPVATRLWSWLVAGDYEVRLTLTDTTSDQQIGCYQFAVTLQNPPCTGFLCDMIRQK